MTVQRWAATTLVMGLVGAGLVALAPAGDLVREAVTAPQLLVDTRGPDALLVLLAWALAALCWAWGVLGLVLTGLSTLPGLAGRAAGIAVLVLVPAGIRRAAAVAVGVSLVAGPVLGVPAPQPSGVALSVAAGETGSVTAVPADDTADPADDTADPGAPGPAPDWPTTTPTAPDPGPADTPPVPDWPAPVPDGGHVVVRGDTLWDLATARLTASDPTRSPSTGSVATAVQAWWQANADVIGDDPDLLLPGQVLRPPP